MGVIVLNLSLDAFADISNSGISETDSYAMLLGDSDTVTYLDANQNSNPPRLLREDIQPLFELSNSDPRTIDGEKYLVTRISCETTNWILVGMMPQQNIIREIYPLAAILILIVVTCLLLSLTTSYFVTISITHPIHRLCTAMKNVEINADTVGYTDPAPDEVGILGRDFNRMLKRNQELIHRVYTIELEKKEETLLRKQAELDALQMQINPHFLYNTLDIIRWQIIEEEGADSSSQKASTMLVRFSNLLKLSTRKSRSLVPLSEEIEHVRAYLQVVEFDVEYAIRLEFDLPDDTLPCMLPKLTLQPLVENAVMHAFSESMEQAIVRISAEKVDDDLLIRVANSGKILSLEQLEQINQSLQGHRRSGDHIGLTNVHDRIRLQFGEAYGIRLSRNQQGLTEVTIRIPFWNLKGEG